jgi:hypothetical protein
MKMVHEPKTTEKTTSNKRQCVEPPADVPDDDDGPMFPAEIMDQIFSIAARNETYCSSASFARIGLVAKHFLTLAKHHHNVEKCCRCLAETHADREILPLVFDNHSHDDAQMARSQCLVVAMKRRKTHHVTENAEDEDGCEGVVTAANQRAAETVGEAVARCLSLTQRRMSELGCVIPAAANGALATAFEESFMHEGTECFDQLWDDLSIPQYYEGVMLEILEMARQEGENKHFFRRMVKEMKNKFAREADYDKLIATIEGYAYYHPLRYAMKRVAA